jgi:hypothetical protein
MSNMTIQPNHQKIIDAINQVIPEYDRIELRAVYPVTKEGKKRTDSGVFDRDHITELANQAVRLNSAAAIYINLNPIKPEFIGPATNTIKPFAKGLFTNDDASKRSLLMVDCDPIRPSNTSSTESQLGDAYDVANTCAEYLRSKGWKSPILAMSGNGYHLLYKIDLPNTFENTKLITEVLVSLGIRFNTQKVKIDTVVANAGRIFKLYGTVANKGPNTVDTPHRLSTVIDVPKTMVIISEEKLFQETPLGYLGKPPQYVKQFSGVINPVFDISFDLNKFLSDLRIGYEISKKDNGLVSYKLDHCPFNPEHGKGDSAISKSAEGKLGFHCFHNSCADKNWHSIRQYIQDKLVSKENILNKNNDWPEPHKLPGELLPVLELNPDWLPEALREGCVDIAERLNCPLDYVAIPAIVGAGTVLGNTVGILPKEHDDSWIVHAGFWGGIVGSPGSMKTPALNASLKPLHHLEEEAASQYKQDCVHYNQNKALFDQAMVNFKAGKSKTFPTEPIKPVKARFIVNDVTYQALGEILANNPRGILVLADELSGLLQGLDTPGQEAARGFYLSGWGGQGSYTFDRITRESVTLNRYQLAVFGGFQPDRIKKYVRFAQSGSSKNDGFLQRFQLLVWPDLSDYFELIDRPADKEALAKLYQAIISLKILSTKSIDEFVKNSSGVQLIHFDKPAQKLFNSWYQVNEKLLRSGSLDASEQGHFAKYRSLIPGLALLFHLINGHTGQVCEDSLATAMQFALYLKSHAKRIYRSVHGLDSAPTRSLAKNLLEYKLTDGFTQRSLLHKGWANLSNKDKVYLAVNALVEHGWLSEHMTESAGRKTTIYKINPKISEKYL